MALLFGGAVDVTVVTDHDPITYLQTQPVLSRRQARWSEYLQTFKFKWLYRPGRCNVADPLSRLPVQGACETAVMSALGTEHALNVMTRGQRARPNSLGKLIKELNSKDLLQKLIMTCMTLTLMLMLIR